MQSYGEDSLSCELNRLSALIGSLSGTQAQVCRDGVTNCKIACENKLEEFKRDF